MLIKQGIRGPSPNVVSSGPDIRQLISDCPSQDPLLQETNEQKIGRRHSDDERSAQLTTFLQYIHPYSDHSKGENKEGRRDPSSSHSLLLCSLLPFGEQFHFSGLNGSETSSAKIPLSSPSLSFPPPSLPLRAAAIY